MSIDGEIQPVDAIGGDSNMANAGESVSDRRSGATTLAQEGAVWRQGDGVADDRQPLIVDDIQVGADEGEAARRATVRTSADRLHDLGLVRVVVRVETRVCDPLNVAILQERDIEIAVGAESDSGWQVAGQAECWCQ